VPEAGASRIAQELFPPLLMRQLTGPPFWRPDDVPETAGFQAPPRYQNGQGRHPYDVNPTSPWSRNPGPTDLEDGDDLDVVFDQALLIRPATLPGEHIRRGARVVRWSAVLLTVISVLGSALSTYGIDGQTFGPYGTRWDQFGQFLSAVSWSIGFAAVVLAASYALTALASRLDLDQALSER
jgi:hypothetical protein